MAGEVRNPRIVTEGEEREEARRGMKKGFPSPSEIILFLFFLFSFGFGLCACIYLGFARRLLPVSFFFVCFGVSF